MRRLLCGCLLAAWPLAATAADGEPVRGAKEVFFSSTDTVVAGRPGQPLIVPQQSAAPPRNVRTAAARRHAATPTLAAMSKPRLDTDAPAVVSVALRYWVELLRSDPRSPGFPAPPDQRFRSGERVRLHFESNVAGHLALFQLGSNGAASRLYPDPAHERPGYPLPPRESRAIPEGTAWFRFDDQPGVEHLLVVFAPRVEQLAALKVASRIDPAATKGLIAGGKNLVLETEREVLSEVGTFVANLTGDTIVVPIDLYHD